MSIFVLGVDLGKTFCILVRFLRWVQWCCEPCLEPHSQEDVRTDH